MKTRILSLMGFSIVILVLTIISSCNESLLTVKVPIIKNFPFPIDSLQHKSSDSLLFQDEVTLNIDSLITAYGGNPAMIDAGIVKSVKATIISPAGLTFGFINSMSVAMQKNQDPETLIAYTTNADPLATNLTFNIISGTNMLTFLQNGQPFILRVYGTVSPPVPANIVNLNLRIEWEIATSPF